MKAKALQEHAFFYACIALSLAGALWYSLALGHALYRHLMLTSITQVESSSWEVFLRESDRYLYRVRYSYSVGGQKFHGMTELPSPVYRNSWGAEQELALNQKEFNRVYYAASAPSFSSLYRSFPLKETLYSAMMWCLALYFIVLALRVY